VLLAMSGGVDSSVAASVLLRAGFEVSGAFMRLGTPGDEVDACETGAVTLGHRGCCSVGDAADARTVASVLGIDLHVLNFRHEFNRIIDYFVDEYAAGRTPNPCVRCNDWLKFGRLHEHARRIGADYVASGHYARVDRSGPVPALRRGLDGAKDQSYVLFGVGIERLDRMLLPVGSMRKAEVRAMARELGLPVFDKPDSQEICFVPDDDYAGLVERRRPELAAAARGKGTIRDADGTPLGEHEGHHRFTIGQRRGVGVALGYPLYVIGADPATNSVTVGGADDLLCDGCTAGEACWLTAQPEAGIWIRCLARCRYNGHAVPARVRVVGGWPGETPSGRHGAFEVAFDEPHRAVAPGQAVVLYDATDPDLVLAGGWIRSALRGAAGAGRIGGP
jgi:tRNA-specific 2-thiouridylase